MVLLISTYIDYAKNSSLHGIKYTVDSSATLLERIFWILIIICSLTCSVYLTMLFWARYTSNPTRTILDTNVASLATVPFPGVTICNVNRILERKLKKMLAKFDASDVQLNTVTNILSNIMSIDKTSRIYQNSFNKSELTIAINVLKENGYADFKSILMRISESCDEMIVKCFWNKRLVRCKDIFHETYTMHGRCCSFNYYKGESVRQAKYTLYYGLFTGLGVMLTPEYNDINSAGVSVTIHHPTDFPRFDSDVRKFLPLNTVNLFQIQASNQLCSQGVKELPFIYRQCIYQDEKQLEYFGKYSYSNCLTICETLLIIDQCQCIPFYYDFMSGKPMCDLRHDTCLENVTDKMKYCDCPSQCENESYEVVLSETNFVTNTNMAMGEYFRNLNNTKNDIWINVFFSTNRGQIWLRDTITSVIYLLSSFGGIYSLFLGCSVITVIELLYYFVGKLVIYNFCCNRKIDKPPDKEEVKIFTFHNLEVLRKLNRSNPVVPYID